MLVCVLVAGFLGACTICLMTVASSPLYSKDVKWLMPARQGVDPINEDTIIKFYRDALAGKIKPPNIDVDEL